MVSCAPLTSILQGWGVCVQTTRGGGAWAGGAGSNRPWALAGGWQGGTGGQGYVPYPPRRKLWLCYPTATGAGVERPSPGLWKEAKGKPPGEKGPLCAWDLAGPPGIVPQHTHAPSAPPSTGLLRLRPVAQKWTRSTSWLANGRWQAVHVAGRERCFSPRQGRHRR